MELTHEHKKQLDSYFEDFKKDSMVEDKNVKMPFGTFDQQRKDAVPDLKAMVADFLTGKLSLTDFKEKSDSMSRSVPYWGFKGFSGQMQLNQYVNNIEDAEKETQLKNALALPKSME